MESCSVAGPLSDSEDITGADLCHCISSDNKTSLDKLKKDRFSLQQVGIV